MAVGDWVPCQQYCQEVVGDLTVVPGPTVIQAQVILCAVGPDTIGAFPDVATVEVEEEVLTKRVVGWVFFRCALTEPTPCMIHERIRVGLRDQIGNMSFFASDFSQPDEANEPFLWERIHCQDIGQVATMWPQGDFGNPGWGKLDVRVARRLRRQDVLVYTCQFMSLTVPFDPSDVCAVIPGLRTWARTLG